MQGKKAPGPAHFLFPTPTHIIITFYTHTITHQITHSNYFIMYACLPYNVTISSHIQTSPPPIIPHTLIVILSRIWHALLFNHHKLIESNIIPCEKRLSTMLVIQLLFMLTTHYCCCSSFFLSSDSFSSCNTSSSSPTGAILASTFSCSSVAKPGS